jgi:hypothetical protein
MKKAVLTVGAVLFVSSSAFAQRLPTFAQYAARVERIRNVQVDLRSQKNARMFRTNLRNAAKEGVNFAGRFTLTGWGCGTNCSEWAIIDGRTGRVFFPREFGGVGFGFCDLPPNALPADIRVPAVGDEGLGPLIFKKGSRLVILTGYTGGGIDNKRAKCGNYFFEWTGTALRQVRFVAGKRTDTP